MSPSTPVSSVERSWWHSDTSTGSVPRESSKETASIACSVTTGRATRAAAVDAANQRPAALATTGALGRLTSPVYRNDRGDGPERPSPRWGGAALVVARVQAARYAWNTADSCEP